MAGTGDYAFPQKAAKLRQGEKGIASLTHHNRTFRFRTNPNEFSWTYTLNKRIDQTYGGRVVQLLGTKIDDFAFKADSGNGGWEYFNRVANFLRDVMVEQRDGTPAVFEYTTRGWKMNCYVVSVPFEDAVEQVLRPFEVQLKVQEDVTGLVSKNTLGAELGRLQDGVGFRRSKYNDPHMSEEVLADKVGDLFGALPVGEVLGYASNIFLPNSPLANKNTNIGRQ